jgi:hypothetical protein
MRHADEDQATPSATPSAAVTTEQPSGTWTLDLDDSAVQEAHEYDALTALLLTVTLIGCLLLAYYVKRFRIYYLPESAGAILVGIVVGGMARLATDDLVLFVFVSSSILRGVVG